LIIFGKGVERENKGKRLAATVPSGRVFRKMGCSSRGTTDVVKGEKPGPSRNAQHVPR